MAKLPKIWVLRSKELEGILGSRMAIKRKAEAGELQSVGSGIYASASLDPMQAAMIAVTRYFPKAVISGHTALFLHQLSDHAVDRIDVDIPVETKIRNRILNVHRVTAGRRKGISELKIQGFPIRKKSRGMTKRWVPRFSCISCRSSRMAKNFLARAKSWAAKRKLLGPQAFLKYVMFTYLDALNRETEEFVFKGGNLLWAYIETPRATVDLDLSTLEEDDDGYVRTLLERVTRAEGIMFHLESFQPTEAGGNTRMKDFDDLWRIAKSSRQIDARKLGRILSARKTDSSMNSSWISEPMRKAWKSHRAKYRDLPEELEDLFREVNDWLG
jgi:hypothetical protein